MRSIGNMVSNDQLCKIASVSNAIEAALITGALADENIWSSQSGEFVAGFATPVNNPITIYVQKDDAHRVRDILSQLDLPYSLSDDPGTPKSTQAGRSLWTEIVTQTQDSYSLLKRRALQLIRSVHFFALRSLQRFRTRTLLISQTILGVILFAIAGQQSTVFSVFFYVAVCLALVISAMATVWAATNATKVREEWCNVGQVAVPIVTLLALFYLLITLFA